MNKTEKRFLIEILVKLTKTNDIPLNISEVRLLKSIIPQIKKLEVIR